MNLIVQNPWHLEYHTKKYHRTKIENVAKNHNDQEQFIGNPQQALEQKISQSKISIEANCKHFYSKIGTDINSVQTSIDDFCAAYDCTFVVTRNEFS